MPTDVPEGDNQILVVAVAAGDINGEAIAPRAIDFGGRPMIKRAEVGRETAHLSVWYLREADLTAAVESANGIASSFEWGADEPSKYRTMYAFFDNVDQGASLPQTSVVSSDRPGPSTLTAPGYELVEQDAAAIINLATGSGSYRSSIATVRSHIYHATAQEPAFTFRTTVKVANGANGDVDMTFDPNDAEIDTEHLMVVLRLAPATPG